jgi:hypothetical protein
MKLNELKESKSRRLNVDTDSGLAFGDTSLIADFVASKVTELDADEAEKNSEGNVDGTITIFLGDNDDVVEITGENFSPLVLKYDSLNDKKRQEVIEDLLAKIKEVVK